MHLFAHYKQEIVNAVEALVGEGKLPENLDVSAITLEPPRDESHGDMATNAAMVLAGQAKQNPRAIAALLQEKLQMAKGVAEVSIAGPGFINLRVDENLWREELADILNAGIAYGDSAIGENARVNVEYVSANPTGPLHIGHARGAVYGDALARLLQKAGYDVTKEYYVNDAGAQIEALTRSAYLRYREACGEAIGEIPEGLYPGEYLKRAGEAIKAEHGDALMQAEEAEWMQAVRPIAVASMLGLIKEDLAALSIHHDVFTSEKALKEAGGIEKAIETLQDRKSVV